jgi:hypothetical protein
MSGQPDASDMAAPWRAPTVSWVPAGCGVGNVGVVAVSDAAPARRLRLALDMFEFGEQMQRARLRRRRPQASDAEIDEAVRLWLLSRPGATLGDAEGRPSQRFA